MANNGNTTGKRDRANEKKRKADEKRSRKRDKNDGKTTAPVGYTHYGPPPADSDQDATPSGGRTNS